MYNNRRHLGIYDEREGMNDDEVRANGQRVLTYKNCQRTEYSFFNVTGWCDTLSLVFVFECSVSPLNVSSRYSNRISTPLLGIASMRILRVKVLGGAGVSCRLAAAALLQCPHHNLRGTQEEDACEGHRALAVKLGTLLEYKY